MSDTEYHFTVRRLREEEGGGSLVEYPDLRLQTMIAAC
jgi:hypothetical protein